MTRSKLLGATLFLIGLVIGMALDSPRVVRASAPETVAMNPSERTFLVNFAEVEEILELGERFKGSYERSLTLSDGSERRIRLTPMLRDGELWVELRDGARVTFMGPNGSTYNGDLLINLRDVTGAMPMPD